MAKMKQIVYKTSKERLMVGIQRATSFSEAGGVWQEFHESGTAATLTALSQHSCCEDIDPNMGIGFMYDFVDQHNFHMILGDFLQPGTPIPEGLVAKSVAKGVTAHVQIEGNDIADILSSAYFLITEAVAETGGQINQENFYWCEVYTLARYCEPLKRGESVIIDYIVPVMAMPQQPQLPHNIESTSAFA